MNRPQETLKSYFDTENPHSLINRVWPSFIPYMEAALVAYERAIRYNESQLKAFCKPDERDVRLRLSFWDEYNLATQENRVMSLQNILSGNTSSEVWNRVYLTDRKKIIWVLTLPPSYTTTMQYLLDLGLKRLREILEVPIYKKSGAPDIAVISQVLKAFQLVDLRVKGSVIQKMQIEQKSLNIHASADQSQQLAENLSTLSTDQLSKIEEQLDRIVQKRAQAAAMLPSTEQRIIDVATDTRVPLEFTDDVSDDVEILEKAGVVENGISDEQENAKSNKEPYTAAGEFTTVD